MYDCLSLLLTTIKYLSLNSIMSRALYSFILHSRLWLVTLFYSFKKFQPYVYVHIKFHCKSVILVFWTVINCGFNRSISSAIEKLIARMKKYKMNQIFFILEAFMKLIWLSDLRPVEHILIFVNIRLKQGFCWFNA